MRSLVAFCGRTLRLDYPESIRDLVAFLFGAHIGPGRGPGHDLAVTCADDGLFSLSGFFGVSSSGLTRDDLPEFLMDAVVRGLVTDQAGGVVLHAAALRRDAKAVLLAGVTGAGKSTLTAWLAARGYEYLTDELVFCPLDAAGRVQPFYRPLVLRADSLRALEAEAAIDPAAARFRYGDKALFGLGTPRPSEPVEVGAILFPSFRQDAAMSLEPLKTGLVALHLLENNLNGANLAAGGLPAMADMARRLAGLRVTYGDFSQIDGVLDAVLDDILSGRTDAGSWYRVHSAFGPAGGPAVVSAGSPAAAPQSRKINAPTPSRGTFKLTVGMATFDDFDGVYFTIQSLRLNNPELLPEIEFLVIDNNPAGPCGDALKDLEKICPTYRYVPFAGQTGTATRDLVFSQASGEFVLCVDCHVLLAPGALARLMDFLKADPDATDLYQGPMLYDGLDRVATHFEPEWRAGMYGTWGTDERGGQADAEPFEIPMQGLGLFACRRDAWPGFNPKFRGFGGEEGYIHEKFRQRGDRTLCLPFLRWLHRFPRPMGVPYRAKWEDRIRNYVLGFNELGLDLAPIEEHFRAVLGKEPADRIVADVKRELSNPFNRFDMIRYINLDERPDRLEAFQKRLSRLGIELLSSRSAAVRTPNNHHVGCALSHRAVIADARQRRLKNVLVFEDDAVFDRDTLPMLSAMLEELDGIEWDVFYLGGHTWDGRGELVPGCRMLRAPLTITTGHALAYNHTVFDRMLADLPESFDGMVDWIGTHYGIDQYLSHLDVRKVLAEPMIAMQVELFSQRHAPDRARFIL